MRADRVRVGQLIDVRGEWLCVQAARFVHDPYIGDYVVLGGDNWTRFLNPDTDIETALPATVSSPGTDAPLPPAVSGRGEP